MAADQFALFSDCSFTDTAQPSTLIPLTNPNKKYFDKIFRLVDNVYNDIATAATAQNPHNTQQNSQNIQQNSVFDNLEQCETLIEFLDETFTPYINKQTFNKIYNFMVELFYTYNNQEQNWLCCYVDCAFRQKGDYSRHFMNKNQVLLAVWEQTYVDYHNNAVDSSVEGSVESDSDCNSLCSTSLSVDGGESIVSLEGHCQVNQNGHFHNTFHNDYHTTNHSSNISNSSNEIRTNSNCNGGGRSRMRRSVQFRNSEVSTGAL